MTRKHEEAKRIRESGKLEEAKKIRESVLVIDRIKNLPNHTEPNNTEKLIPNRIIPNRISTELQYIFRNMYFQISLEKYYIFSSQN